MNEDNSLVTNTQDLLELYEEVLLGELDEDNASVQHQLRQLKGYLDQITFHLVQLIKS